MAKLKLSDVLKCKKVEELEEMDFTPATWEKVKEMLEDKQPKGYEKTVKLIDNYLYSLLEEENGDVEIDVEEEKPKKESKRGGKRKETKKEEKAEEEQEEYELLGGIYVETTIAKKDFKEAIIPQTSVLLFVDEGEEEVTIFTPVWIGEEVITCIDLSRYKDVSIEFNTKEFFNGKLKSVAGFKGELVATLIRKSKA